MILIIIFVLLVLTVIYVVFRYAALICAIHTIQKEIDEMNQDLTQNQIVHLPLPDPHLRKLLCSINDSFAAIQKERQRYETREREFQNQIELISHDLRTPLTVILGYIRLFRNSDTVRLSEDENLHHTLNVLEQKAYTLKHLITQFYDYSRLTAGDYELTPEQVDAARMLRESLMGSYQLLEQAQLHIAARIPEHPVWISADPAALERIFLNVFQNAGRYADTFFQITVQEQTDCAVILFENDTSKLSKEDLPYLFDRFYVHDPSRSQGSTGLGLTVARSLAEKMNGSLTAHILQDPASLDEICRTCVRLQLKLLLHTMK